MAYFEKREWIDNKWHPEIAGVDLTERLYKFMGEVALDGTEIYTAWLVDDDLEVQITPESSRIFLSLIDDDSDTITVLDPTDGLWFYYVRVSHPDTFQNAYEIIQPWSTVTVGLTPAPEVYAKFMDIITRDTTTDTFHVPDDWC